MELQQLKYFQTVAKLEHFTRAAEELYVAQPSLSRSIARLEEELGVLLFDRSGRQVRLNQFGRCFLQRVERAFHELEMGQRELEDLIGQERGQVGLVFQHTVGAQILPGLLSAFLAQHPNITFRLSHTSTAPVRNQLEEGNFDMCITSLPTDRQGLEMRALMTEEIFLAVPLRHRLARRGSVQLSEAAEDFFICMKSGYSLREIGDAYCRQAGFEPKVAFEGDEMPTVRGLVAAGLGVALIPALGWQSVMDLTPIKLKIEEPICQRTIWLAWSRGHYLSSAAQLFQQFVIEYFAQLT